MNRRRLTGTAPIDGPFLSLGGVIVKYESLMRALALVPRGTPYPLYVCAPYAAPTIEGVAENVARAVRLGEALIRLCPDRPVVVPHAMGAAGVYGSPADDGSASESRARALRQGAAWAKQSIVVVLIQNGASEGMLIEMDAAIRTAMINDLDAFEADIETLRAQLP